MDARRRVVLLRAPAEPDPYVAALEARGWSARCVPVLSYTWTPAGDLAHSLNRPDAYAGLIATSPRAAEALRHVALDARWRERAAYAVGTRTADGLRAVGLVPRGEASGDAEALARYVVDEAAKGAAKPLLFLCGNRRRETLPHRLAAHGVAFEELEVYQTHLRTDVALGDPPPAVLVFFSPSGVEAVGAAHGEVVASVRRVAIGPTTAAALDGAGWPADGVAAAPTPEGVAEAVDAVMRRAPRR